MHRQTIWHRAVWATSTKDKTNKIYSIIQHPCGRRGGLHSWCVRLRIGRSRFESCDPFPENPATFQPWKAVAKYKTFIPTEVSLHTRFFWLIHLSAFRYRLTKIGFCDLKSFRGFQETGPCCVLGQDTLSTCINGYRVPGNLLLGGTLQWTSIQPRGGGVEILLVTSCYWNRRQAPAWWFTWLVWRPYDILTL